MQLTRSERAHLALARRVPFWAGQRPEAAWFALACFLTGIPTALGALSPNAIASTLPPYVGHAWGVDLLIGSSFLWSGLTSLRLDNGGVVMIRPRDYKLGVRLLVWGSLLYVAAIGISAGWRGLAAGSMILAFALAHFLRLNTIVVAEIQDRRARRG